MLEFITNYGGTILVCAIIAAVMVLLVRSLIKDKKKGKTCCGGCAGCAMSGSCSSAQNSGKKAVDASAKDASDNSCGKDGDV